MIRVRLVVWDLSGDRQQIHEIAEAPAGEAFRADGHTLAGNLGKLYRENVNNPDRRIEVFHKDVG